MKRNFYFILFSVLIISCNKNKKDSKDHDVETGPQTVGFTIESLTEKDFSSCESQKCPEITVNYLQANEEVSSSETINSKISDFVIASFQIEENTKNETVKDAAQQFVKLYHDDLTRFPDIAGVYSAHIDVKEIYQSPELISLELSQYLYTGGAHGNGSTTFLNMDPKDGRTLNLEDLFSDFNEFKNFAEKKFREKNKIAQTESINSTGFWFDDDEFYLPETVGFTLDNLVFIYNNYEITSYADSPVEFKISKSEANPFLKSQYNL